MIAPHPAPAATPAAEAAATVAVATTEVPLSCPKGKRAVCREEIFSSRTRGGNQRRAEEPASGSWHALLVDLAHQGEETDPEEGFGRYEFGELSD